MADGGGAAIADPPMRVLAVMAGCMDSSDDLLVFGRRYPHLFGLLTAADVELHVALLGRSPKAAALLNESTSATYEFGPTIPPSPRGAVGIPLLVPRVRRLIRDIRPDIVDGGEPLPAITAGLASRVGSRPVVVYRRQHGSRRRPGLLVASRFAAALADNTIVTNRADAKLAAEMDGSDPRNIIVTPSGVTELRSVSEEELVSTRRALQIPQDAKVIVAVCRLRLQKGIDVLISAIDQMSTDSHLVVVGSGPERSALERLARASRRKVHLVGHQDDVSLWFALSDVVAIPSRSEAFGRTTVEAMCAGRPIVASRVGGLGEAVDDGVTGLLVPPDDSGSLSRALDRLLRDERLASDMGKAARQRFETHHTMEMMARSWKAGWEEALRTRRDLEEVV